MPTARTSLLGSSLPPRVKSALLSDDELQGIVRGAAAASERIVNHRLTADALAAVSDALVDRRTLTASELDELLGPRLPAHRELFEGGEWTVTIGGGWER